MESVQILKNCPFLCVPTFEEEISFFFFLGFGQNSKTKSCLGQRFVNLLKYVLCIETCATSIYVKYIHTDVKYVVRKINLPKLLCIVTCISLCLYTILQLTYADCGDLLLGCGLLRKIQPFISFFQGCYIHFKLRREVRQCHIRDTICAETD